MRRIFVFLRFTGARPGEMRTAEWADINWERRTITLRRHKTSWTTGKPRVIHLNAVACGLLRFCWRLSRPGQQFVFVNAYRRPWTISALTKQVRTMRDRAGVAADVKLHGARHTFGTQAILNGVEVPLLAELLGHRTTKTTERYVHLADKTTHLAEAAERAVGRQVRQPNYTKSWANGNR